MNLPGSHYLLRGLFAICILIAAGAVIGTGNAWSAPITFNTALPVAKGEFLLLWRQRQARTFWRAALPRQ